jgi:energy-coupling factor transport system ATP-binding protein
VGLVFQFPEYQLFEETVQKDIMFGPMNFKISAADAAVLAQKAIVQVGLDETYLKRNPFNLSGGEKKRVSIAGILALDPDILVLDEPTSGLDPKGKSQMMELFTAIQKQTDKTIIIITHDMDLVYRYMDRVIVMHEGRLIRDESPDRLFHRKNLAELHLDYPETISVLAAIKAQFSLDIDIYQKDMDAALVELRRAVGK